RDDGSGAADPQPRPVPAGQPAVSDRRTRRVPAPTALLRGRGRMRRLHLKSFRDRNQVVVGIVGILLIIAVVTGVFAISTSGILEDRYQLTAVFERTGGLETAADVRFDGVPV